MVRRRSAVPIPASHRDLFEKRALAHLATLMPDGSPQVTPVWVLLEGGLVVVNSAQGRQKDRNMRARPRVALSIVDPDDPARYLAVRRPVVEITEAGADEVIARLRQKYRGAAGAGGGRPAAARAVPAETRVTYRIRPVRVSARG